MKTGRKTTPFAPGTRLAVAVLSVMLAFLVLGVGLAVRNYRTERRQQINQVARLADSAGLNAERFLDDRLDVLGAIAEAPTVRSGDLPSMLAYFQSLDPEGLGFAGGIAWVDASGMTRISTAISPGQLPVDVSDRPYVRAVITSNQPFVGAAVIGRVQAAPLLPLVVPTYDRQGQFSGMLLGSLRLDLLEAATKEQRFGTDDLIILDRDGNIIAMPDPITELVNVADDQVVKLSAASSSGLLTGTENLSGTTGDFIGYAHAPSGGWTIFIDRTDDQVIGGAKRTLTWELVGLLTVAVATFAGMMWFAHRINRASAREDAARNELGLRESRLSSLTEATTQVIWTVEPDGELREPAVRWSALTGLPVAALDGESWLPYVHPDDRDTGNAAWKAGIAGKSMIEFEQRVTRANGDEHCYMVRAVPVTGDDGQLREWIGVDIDITEQRRVERSLRDRETFARDVIDNLFSFVGVTTPDGVIIDVNRAAIEMARLTRADLIGHSIWDAPFFAGEPEVQRLLRAAIERARAGEPVRMDLPARIGGDRVIMLDFAIGSIRDRHGTVTNLIPSAMDVTMRADAERRITESEERYRGTAERLSLALEAGQLTSWDWDAESDELVWTEASEIWNGRPPATLTELYERMQPDDRAAVQAAWQRAIEEVGSFEADYRVLDDNDEARWISARGDVFRGADGRVSRVIGIDVDVTDRKNREAFEQAFVANIAHDVKNPLAAVKAQTQLLRRRLRSGRAEPSSVDGVLGVIDSGLERMNRRIEELADVARLRAGSQLELRQESVDLPELVAGIVETYQGTTERHAIIVTGDGEPLDGLWDAGRIDRVVDNLVSNAIKYSPRGGEVEIDLRRDGNDAVLTVSDHGIGIPAEDVEHIFERYRRAGNTTFITGTGIGLAGARQIVEQHGGRIEVASEEGSGSVFRVYLPLAPSLVGTE